MALWTQNLGVRLGTRRQAMDSAVAEVLAVAADAEVQVVEAELEVLVVGFEVRGTGPTFPAAGPGAVRPGHAGWVASPSPLPVPVSAIQVEKVSLTWAASGVWRARDGTVKKMEGMEKIYRQRCPMPRGAQRQESARLKIGEKMPPPHRENRQTQQ